MKYLVVSDLHGSCEYANKLIDIIEMEIPDKIILLGDLYNYDSKSSQYVASILNIYKDIILCTKGNCDTTYSEQLSKFDLKDSIRLTIGNKNFFFNHGHIYNINNIPNNTDILIYGHLHTGFIRKCGNTFVINSGSISYPRKNTSHSYLLIDDEYIYLKDILGSVLNSVKFN